ncbi:MAG: PASTA domain-containing protein [Oscillospiraceae bacterium]|jgi:serine/threonine-protein kinase|nr:PASTA domain-containing protein [Oscillospiraceae bacterium]
MFVNEIMQRCARCMHLLGGTAVCPACGAPAQFAQPAPFLPLRTHLAQGRFGVGCSVEQNGDGITYLAFDQQTRKPVYLREFFPASIAVREQGQLTQLVMQGCEIVWQDCAQNFIELWRKLCHLRGLSALIAVTDVFEENNTCYAVYEYVEHVSLREFLLRGKQGCISWERARALLMPVLSTLGSLHQQGILHRGISPNTLLFGTDGKVRIGGFSIWQARTAHGDLTADLADGYAALEQYGLEDQQGAWTDIYAFAAVLYRSLIGSAPDNAVSRRHNDRVMVPAQFAERIPAYVINALINAMQVFPEDRTRTVEQLRAELSASPAAIAQAAPAPRTVSQLLPLPATSTETQEKKKKKRRASAGKIALRTAAIIVAAGLALAILVMGVFFPAEFARTLRGLAGTNQETTSLYTEPSSQTETVTVPALTNKDFDEDLEKQLRDLFNLVLVYREDELNPDGRILDQDLRAGLQFPRGTTFTLYISRGKTNEELPDIVGKNLAAVRKELEELGFVIVSTERANDGTHKAGVIVSVVPDVRNEYPRGTELFITVWGRLPGEEPATAAETTTALPG